MPNKTLNFSFCSTRVIFPCVIDGHWINTEVYSETTQKLKIDRHETLIKMGLILGKAVPVTLFANLVMEYRINREIYTSYVGAARMVLHINGKFTMK